METKFIILLMGPSNQFQNLETLNPEQNLFFDLIWSDFLAQKQESSNTFLNFFDLPLFLVLKTTSARLKTNSCKQKQVLIIDIPCY